MKLIRGIVRPDRVDAVLDALVRLDVSGLTMREVRGHGRQMGHPAVYRGRHKAVTLLPKVEIDVVVPNDVVERTGGAIMRAARTGDIGDGRVFVLPVGQGYRISTGKLERD